MPDLKVDRITARVQGLSEETRREFGLDECCLECGEHRPGDERVKHGMKCMECAYGYSEVDAAVERDRELPNHLVRDDE